MSKGLGRRRVFDSRDELYPMRKALPRRIPNITSKYWPDNSYWKDQGTTSECVPHSLIHWIHDSPVTHPKAAKPIISHAELYREAQLTDEWPGEDYDGTSVRAGAGVLQKRGFIASYTWAWDLETMVDAILTKAPVVVGTTWYDSMFEPNEKGVITIDGNAVGGHAYVVNGVNLKTRLLRIKNSWGRSWGKDGRAYISFDDFDQLIKDAGEVMLAIENK